MNRIVFFSCFLLLLPIYTAASCIAPSFNKKIENYEIIAGNTAKISVSEGVKGSYLIFSFTAKNKSSNPIKIDETAGLITIEANKKDAFDVRVSAENACGRVSSALFNVIIDEEE